MVGLRRHRRVEPPAPVEEVAPHEAAPPEPVSEGPAAPPPVDDASDAGRGRGFLHAVPAVDEADPEADPGVEREAERVFDQDQEEETAPETPDAVTTHAELPDAELLNPSAQPSEAPIDAHVADSEPDDDAGDGTVAVTDDETQAAGEDRAIDDADEVVEAERVDVADDVELDEAELDEAEAEVETVARRPLEVRAGALDGPILDPETLPDAAARRPSPSSCRGSSRSRTRRVVSARPRPRSTWAPPWPNSTSGCWSSTSTRRATPPPASGSIPATSRVRSTTCSSTTCRSRTWSSRRRCGTCSWRPATIDLAGAEIELVPTMSRELRLKRAIDQVRPDYDLVLIDCPPSLGLLTVNGLAAADDVIVPIQCEYYALEGLGQLLRNVGLVQSNFNQSLDVRGIVLTMYDARTKLADQVESEVRNYFGPKVYRTVVPRTVRLSEAPSFGQPIIVFDSTSRGAERVPRAGQGGEPWRDQAGSVGDSAR